MAGMGKGFNMRQINRITQDTTADRIYAFKASCKVVFIAIGGSVFIGGLMLVVAILESIK